MTPKFHLLASLVIIEIGIETEYTIWVSSVYPGISPNVKHQ